MRKSLSLRICGGLFLAAGVLIIASAPAAGKTNWIGATVHEPVPQWALDATKTPTPASAKDAPAVVLFDEYLETVDAQGRATEREREAIRILTPRGRDDAACNISYSTDEKINYFRSWTVAADGKQFQAQDADFADVGEDAGIPVMLSASKSRIVHPVAADVGATVICESEELLAPYQQEIVWEIQHRIPIVFQALEVDLPAGQVHAESWHRYQPVKPVEVAPNHWRWEVKEMLALDLREVRSSPEWSALAARMSVYWGDAAVEGRDNQWKALGQWVEKLQTNRSDPSPEITAKTQELVAAAPDLYAKLSRITDYIQKNIRYFIVERGIGGWQAHYAKDIYRNRYGDCKDKTTLLISMLHASGLHGFYLAVDSRRGVVDPEAPSRYGNHMITAIEIPADVQDQRLQAIAKAKDGKRYLIFDPTDERTPVGNLPSYLQGGYGILAAGTSSQILALPVLAPEVNGTEQKGSFTLSADGVLSGSVDTFHTGPEGGYLRTFLKYTDDKERREGWERYIAQDLPGLALESFQFAQPEALDKPLEFHYKVSVPQYAHQMGSLLMVRVRVVGDVAAPFDDKTRTLPINLGATGRWRDSFDIKMPDGYAVDEMPDPTNVDMDFASYHSAVTAKDGVLHYEREYAVRQVEIPATEAAEFRKLEGAILFDEKGTAVLKKQ